MAFLFNQPKIRFSRTFYFTRLEKPPGTEQKALGVKQRQDGLGLYLFRDGHSLPGTGCPSSGLLKQHVSKQRLLGNGSVTAGLRMPRRAEGDESGE